VMCRRYCVSHGLDESKRLRHLISRFMNELSQRVAQSYNCSVWVLSQLSGEANKKAPTSVQHYADAAEGKNFAENLDYCFCLGNKDTESRCAQFMAGKTRRTEGMARPTVVQLTRFSKLVSNERDFAVDQVQRRIVSRRDLERVVDPNRARSGP